MPIAHGSVRKDPSGLRCRHAEKPSRQSLCPRVAPGRAGGVINSSTGIGQPCPVQQHGKLRQQDGARQLEGR